MTYISKKYFSPGTKKKIPGLVNSVVSQIVYDSRQKCVNFFKKSLFATKTCEFLKKIPGFINLSPGTKLLLLFGIFGGISFKLFQPPLSFLSKRYFRTFRTYIPFCFLYYLPLIMLFFSMIPQVCNFLALLVYVEIDTLLLVNFPSYPFSD